MTIYDSWLAKEKESKAKARESGSRERKDDRRRGSRRRRDEEEAS